MISDADNSKLPLKIAVAQIEVVPGRPDRNLETCLNFQRRALSGGADVVVFPELCLSGYLIGDLWEEESFVRDCVAMGEELAAASEGGVTCFGNVGVTPGTVGEDGRPRRYNGAWISAFGKLLRHPVLDLSFWPKSLLPNYREFEETRHFFDLRRLAQARGIPPEEAVQPAVVTLRGRTFRLGVYLCEDGWHEDYRFDVPGLLVRHGAEVLINLSASPFTLGKESKRHRVFSAQASGLGRPLVYVNCAGMQNNAKTLFSFDGNSTVYDAEGIPLFQAPDFTEALAIVDLTVKGTPCPPAADDRIEKIHQCLVNTVGTFMRRSGLERVAVGVSGGIDSAVSAAFFTHLLGPENVLLVNMPSEFNTETTKGLAAELVTNLGTWSAVIPIGESVALTRQQMDGLVIERPGAQQTLTLSGFHLENVQARDRSARILAALAAAFGGVFPSNANKAETTVGYATLLGDHAGFMAPFADLWKHQIYALGEHLNQEVFQREVIPQGVFDLRPSAELSDAQNPETGGGDPLVYWYHDKLFQAWMQQWHRAAPEEILEWYADGTLKERLGLERPIEALFSDPRAFIEDLERWWRLFKGMGVVKRLMAPPVAAVCRRAFGFDYREAVLQPYLTRRYLALREALLKRG